VVQPSFILSNIF